MAHFEVDVPDELLQPLGAALEILGLPGATPREKFLSWARAAILNLIDHAMHLQAERGQEAAEKNLEDQLAVLAAKLEAIK